MGFTERWRHAGKALFRSAATFCSQAAIFSIGMGTAALSPSAVAEPPPSPEAVVTARMAAVNANNLDAFLATYADDVEIFVYPAAPLTMGKARLKGLFEPLMAAGDLAVEVSRMITVDSLVVVERVFSFGNVSEPGVALYEVRDGLIQRVTFLRNTRRARQVPRAVATKTHDPQSSGARPGGRQSRVR